MNFFAWQDAARKRTRLLLVLMLLAILALTLGVNLLAGVLMLSLNASVGLGQLIHQPSLLLETLTWEFFTGSLLFILLLVGGGSYYRIRSLSGGGHTIAQALGGRFVNPDQCSSEERQLLNVVEEMAIASGMPVPCVYLLTEEASINAFAAGSDFDNAVIGVTQGCLEQLSRDELEGVIAHEFSHIVHGDMRLNLRLMGVVFGITMLSEMGQVLLRSGSGRRRYHSSSKRSGGGALAVVGLGLLLLGWAGTFFGNWIRASVSRTREFLADASAIQYSRSPDGLACALKRIGGSARGTLLSSSHASEASHMLFANGLKGWLTGLFATHPPLSERIEKLDPLWDGAFLPAVATPSAKFNTQTQPHNEDNAAAKATISPLAGSNLPHAIAQIGAPKAEHIVCAKTLLAQLPPAVHQACQRPEQVAHVLQALMISPNSAEHAVQRQLLSQSYSEGVADQVLQLAAQIQTAALPDHLVLLEIALPTLRRLSLQQREQLKKSLLALAKSDQTINLFEWTLIAIVRHQLEQLAETVIPVRDHFYDLQTLAPKVKIILAALCRVSKMAKEQQHLCYQQALATLAFDEAPMPNKQIFNQLYPALKQARHLYPHHKELLLNTCCRCIQFDGQIKLAEAQTLRAVAILLDCPIPPLVNSID